MAYRRLRTLERTMWLPLLASLPLACSDVPAPAQGVQRVSAEDQRALRAVTKRPFRDVCDAPSEPDVLRCFAKVRVEQDGHMAMLNAPSGLGPADLVSAYAIPASGTAATVAVVVAYDNPNAEADLGVYRSTFGLPPCTTANGCFKKVNQCGADSPLPAPRSSWAREIALDIAMVSAVCPACKILLVEAVSATTVNLGSAVNTAVRLGATVVSNSYGGVETEKAPAHDRDFFTHPGVAMFASSGDTGYQFGTAYPASSAGVIAVGGTTLTRSTSSRGWAEAVWGGASAGGGGGSGCSDYVMRPPWVPDGFNCANKIVADVSAVSDPDTGVAVYSTYDGDESGWSVFGGTSAAAPIVAGIFALAGKGNADGSLIWNNHASFHDVTTGTNYNGAPTKGQPCEVGGNPLCNGVVGFDAPTGWGTPNGTALRDIGLDAGADAGDADAGPIEPGDAGACVLPPSDDAGVNRPDADAGARDAGSNDAMSIGGGGCACSAAPGENARAAWPTVLLVAALLLRHRRTRR